jgi:Tropinone reductase 1
MNRWSLTGKKALITGATKGIGLAVAEEFASLGAELALLARNKDELEYTVQKFKAKGVSVFGIQADVSKRFEYVKIFDALKENWVKLDILINNVGTNIRKKSIEYDYNEFDHIINTNLRSAFELSSMIHPLLKKSDQGNVVFVSSVSGLTHIRTGSIYAMTKAALNQLSMNLAVEWASDGIRVNTVAPWYIRTPLAETVLQNKDYKDEVLDRTPMKKIGEPEDVAAAVSFLCMPASAYITGQVLAIDGGFSVYGF